MNGYYDSSVRFDDPFLVQSGLLFTVSFAYFGVGPFLGTPEASGFFNIAYNTLSEWQNFVPPVPR